MKEQNTIVDYVKVTGTVGTYKINLAFLKAYICTKILLKHVHKGLLFIKHSCMSGDSSSTGRVPVKTSIFMTTL